jgi:choline dehydrogenase-like flavoprotein
MKQAIVVGSGAGGATIAKELQGKYAVTVLEAGEEFRPFSANMAALERLRNTGLLFDEKMIQLIFSAMRIRKTEDHVVLVNGIGTGGTTAISTANAVWRDQDLRRIGINLDAEYKELKNEIPISTEHQKSWQTHTNHLFDTCQEMGLQPVITPKMIDFGKCIRCGRCIFGCSREAKWDSRYFLKQALDNGARLIKGCRVQKVIIEQGQAVGVQTVSRRRSQFYPADLIILAAGGLGTPVILRNSGLECEASLFIDPVLCVAAKWERYRQNQEIPMPFIIQREHLIISPYFDFLSFFFNKKWKFPASDILSLQIKLADSNRGSILDKVVQKTLTQQDQERLIEGVELCKEILKRLGVKEDSIFLGTINAGHPGGMLPLTENESDTYHHGSLPKKLYVADATILPDSMGNPPSLTIMALAKRISKQCLSSA